MAIDPSTEPVVTVRQDEPDPRNSLQHVLAKPDNTNDRPAKTEREPETHDPSEKKSMVWIHEAGREHEPEEKNAQSDSYSRAADINPSYTMTVVHSRRNANGTIGSVYSGNKIRHLKKDDGIPLWRKDIQYNFLHTVFHDKTPVFTLDVDGSKGHCFADIYIQAMARSSKTSKVLREKLLSDRESALNMAMVCLLVNVGRMNTTLNCTYPRRPLPRGFFVLVTFGGSLS
jgi:Ino eighty subunit 1